MAAFTRILPRNWDGRRLLRFLAGLALIALSFAVTVDAAVVPDGPTTTAAPGHPTPDGAAAGAMARPPEAPPAIPADAAPQAPADATGHADATGPALPHRTPVQAVTAPRILALPALVLVGDVVVRRVAPPTATVPGAHGSRAPPRA